MNRCGYNGLACHPGGGTNQYLLVLHTTETWISSGDLNMWALLLMFHLALPLLWQAFRSHELKKNIVTSRSKRMTNTEISSMAMELAVKTSKIMSRLWLELDKNITKKCSVQFK